MKILVNNFNRANVLNQMLSWLRTLGCEIYILDNNSNFGPTLALYDLLDEEIIRLGSNFGHLPPISVFEELVGEGEKFIYSDPDLVPDWSMPEDVIERMSDILDSHPCLKVGPQLRFDDIPDHNPLKGEIQSWESYLLKKPLPSGQGYLSPIDTTFAMYRDLSALGNYMPSIRMAVPYVLRHVDWYEDPEHPTEEYRNYLKTCNDSASFACKIRKLKTSN